ncbi:MAG: hypothetical protein ED555_07735 [Allomuricauda sp.]|nr:MAG: hypothetical protein ED555_07735 [Allomuricauda sp.]
MKKLFSLLTIVVLISVSNCSEIPENNDPVLGIWAKIESEGSNQEQTSDREEWIFNDAYLGRYQQYEGNNITFYTDFGWTVENGVYTIEYRGTDIETQRVMLVKSDNPETLAYENGSHFATRE